MSELPTTEQATADINQRLEKAVDRALNVHPYEGGKIANYFFPRDIAMQWDKRLDEPPLIPVREGDGINIEIASFPEWVIIYQREDTNNGEGREREIFPRKKQISVRIVKGDWSERYVWNTDARRHPSEQESGQDTGEPQRIEEYQDLVTLMSLVGILGNAKKFERARMEERVLPRQRASEVIKVEEIPAHLTS